MANADGFRRVAEWVRKDKDIKAVVVSAGGRVGNLPKVTDLLIECGKNLSSGMGAMKSLNPFFERVTADAQALGLYENIKDELMIIEQEVESGFSLDFLISRGEYVYAKLFSAYSGLTFCDAKDIIVFYDDGRLNLGHSEYKIKEFYEMYGKFVVGGFYGGIRKGEIKTFSRGGSDFSGSIVARGLGAEEYLNFTDVDGIFSFDPRLGKGEVLSDISFDAVRLLGEFGAGVLHPASVLPLYGTGTAIRLKNTFNPNADGTLIREKCEALPFAVAMRRGVTRLVLRKTESGYSLLQKAIDLGGKVVASASSLDFVEVCLIGAENFNLRQVFGVESCKIQGEGTLFYFTPCEKSNRIIFKLKEKKIPQFISDFGGGVYLFTDKNGEIEVISTLNEI